MSEELFAEEETYDWTDKEARAWLKKEGFHGHLGAERAWGKNKLHLIRLGKHPTNPLYM